MDVNARQHPASWTCPRRETPGLLPFDAVHATRHAGAASALTGWVAGAGQGRSPSVHRADRSSPVGVPWKCRAPRRPRQAASVSV